MYTMTAHKVTKATQPHGPHTEWMLEVRAEGRELKPIKTARAINAAVTRRLPSVTGTETAPKWVAHIVGPDIDVWSTSRVFINFGRGGLTIKPHATRINPPTLVAAESGKETP